MSAGDWWCEAYGPPTDGADPATWPRCFIHQDGQHCSTQSVCAHTMAAERRRVFGRINELALDGDNPDQDVFRHLAEEFATPDMLLGGPEKEEPR